MGPFQLRLPPTYCLVEYFLISVSTLTNTYLDVDLALEGRDASIETLLIYAVE